MTRFQVSKDGRTPIQAHKGTAYRSTVFGIMEQALGKLDENKRSGKLEEGWLRGAWVSRAAESDEHVIATPQGLILRRTARGVEESGSFDEAEARSFKGVPRNIKRDDEAVR